MFNEHLHQEYDAIVMLTWSNWKTELRSNRYHYATRFAKIVPVIFVQPDLEHESYQFEESDVSNVTILHVYNKYGNAQTSLLNKALVEAGCLRPIFWVYNIFFTGFLRQRFSILNIYHGTEDYLTSKSRLQFKDDQYINAFNQMLELTDLLVCVSDGVADSFLTQANYKGRIVTITNGCDYKFYKPQEIKPHHNTQKIQIFYQGNIFDKLDYKLLIQLAKKFPSWKFVFAGRVIFKEAGWRSLCKLPNVEYVGILSPEQLKEKAYISDIGIIPFVESEWLIERSFPLKAFEYLACGLPVVSVPIKALKPFSEVITFASGIEEFSVALERAVLLKNNQQYIEKCLESASLQDYDLKFEECLRHIHRLSSERTANHEFSKYTAGILCEFENKNLAYMPLFQNFISHSSHDIYYIPFDSSLDIAVIKHFDVIIIPAVKQNITNYLIHPVGEIIKKYGGYKIIFSDSTQEKSYLNELVLNLGVQKIFGFNENNLLTNDINVSYVIDFDKYLLEQHVLARTAEDKYSLSVIHNLKDRLELSINDIACYPTKCTNFTEFKRVANKLTLHSIAEQLSSFELIKLIFNKMIKNILKLLYHYFRMLPNSVKTKIVFWIPISVKKIIKPT
ncbi:glycosyltransferase [Legionella impletisoli]|uniref:Glycosyl transferase family 1 domain-containing protein n=1 Tax=Legionella impletisoli TaxID=343510 RepID=A0A917N9L8_9GAMM|nr:glycosyltransferase [Legionella impletisoli]GGI80132.1 hypothetical protein GCM10007966_05790 [Legionella impletisoli]